MSQKLPKNGFKWINDVTEIDEKFIKNYDENSDKGYILEVDVKYPRKLHDLHSDLPFSPKRMKIDKCKKLVCNLRNEKKYVVHIRSLKQVLNHGLKLKKVHRIIEFNQETWLKPYINDLPNVSNILDPIMFADDSNLFYSHCNIKELFTTVNKELQKRWRLVHIK